MKEFPGTELRRKEIETAFRAELMLASDMFSFWYHRPVGNWIGKAKLDNRVKQVSFALNIQACRQFRSIVELCRISEAFNANIVARSLYETVLAAFFVLKPRFHISIAADVDKGTGLAKPNKWRARLPGKRATKSSVSRERRASLYRAHCVFYGYQQLADRFADNYMRDQSSQLDPPFDPRIVRAAEMEIGPQWNYILRNPPKTYSGLSVADLANAVGSLFPKWYRYVYGDQSRMTHAVDALQFLQVDQKRRMITATWLSSDNAISCALYCGITMFFAHMVIFKQYIASSWGTESLLDDIQDKYLELFGKRPPQP